MKTSKNRKKKRKSKNLKKTQVDKEINSKLISGIGSGEDCLKSKSTRQLS